MKMNSDKVGNDRLFLFLFPVLFYAFFCFFDGVVICVDSPTYIDMALSREPFYPFFLAINRVLFGEGYLQIVVLCQSLLMAYAVYRISYFVQREFALPIYIGWLLEMVCIATSLLCRFVAKRGSMYSNSIMTEAVCIPLFLLFSQLALDYLFYENRKSLLGATACSFIMISSRKQMYITMILLLVIILFVHLIRHKSRKKVLVYVAVVLLGIIGCNKGFEYTYSYVVHGETASHFNDNRFLATMIFFVAESEDATYIQDNEIRDLFEDILSICTDSGYTRQTCQEESLRGMVSFFADHYDHIQIDTMWPMIEDFSAGKISDPENMVARETMTDEVTSQIISDLLPHTWTRIAEIFWGSCIHGYFNTVAKDHSVLNVFSVILGILYILLLAIQIRKDWWCAKDRSSEIQVKQKMEILSKASLLGIYVIAAMGLNIAVVSMFIFCQTRYMIYNMPLFYIALIVLLVSVFGDKKGYLFQTNKKDS